MAFKTSRSVAQLAALIGFLASGAASAQDATSDETAALQERQKALFAQMLDAPDNIQLMFDYAEVSIRLRDYEAAISTLERLLVFRQDLPRVRLELAVAYFNLGSYEASRLYFGQVLNDPATDDETRRRVQPYLDAIASRTAQSDFSLVASLGVVYSTNANLAPSSDNVTLFGNPDFVLDEDSREQDDFGGRLLVRGTHVYDLQRPNSDAWISDVSFFGLKYAEEERGDTAFFSARTGPRLAIANEQNAPTFRPFVGGQYLYADDSTVYVSGNGGVEYVHRFGGDVTAFSDVSVGYFDFEDARNEQDRFSVDGRAGLAKQFAPGVLGQASVLVGYDDADADFNDNVEVGGRARAIYAYDSGFGLVDRKWSLSGFAEWRYRWYSEADPTIDPDEEREDVDLRFGASHLFSISDGFGVQADVETFNRFSNIQNFELENINFSLSVQYRL